MTRYLKSKSAILIVISVSLLFSLTVWFSANAIVTQLINLWALNEYDIALLSMILIIQTHLGFGISLFSIQLMPVFMHIVSWSFWFTILALGPLIGILSLFLLRREPDSINIGQGKK